jgi:hypothetical protein
LDNSRRNKNRKTCVKKKRIVEKALSDGHLDYTNWLSKNMCVYITMVRRFEIVSRLHTE